MANTAFVTGSTGFVGLNLLQLLRAKGWKSFALHRKTSNTKYVKQLGAKLVEGDITDPASLSAAVPGDIDVIFHAAANTNFNALKNVQQTKDNVEGTRNVVEVALAKRCKRLVHVSSMAATGIYDAVINEQTPSNSKDSGINYFRTKAMAEDEVSRGIENGLDAVIVIPANILGPFDQASWARVVFMIKDGKFPGVGNGGGSFCHVSEVAKALIAAAENGKAGDRYMLGGPPISYQQVVEAIQKEVGGKVPSKPLPTLLLNIVSKIVPIVARIRGKEPEITPEMAKIFTNWMKVDDTKAQKELGYRSVPLETMVKDTCQWLASEGLV